MLVQVSRAGSLVTVSAASVVAVFSVASMVIVWSSANARSKPEMVTVWPTIVGVTVVPPIFTTTLPRSISSGRVSVRTRSNASFDDVVASWSIA